MIITNNTLVRKDFSDIEYIEGDFLDVLNRVREKVYSDYILVSHPLGASIRMMFSPVRSIIIDKIDKKLSDTEDDGLDDLDNLSGESRKVIDEAIEKYAYIMGKRNPDIRNTKDYEKIDYILLKSAIEEINFINNIKRGEVFEVRT